MAINEILTKKLMNNEKMVCAKSVKGLYLDSIIYIGTLKHFKHATSYEFSEFRRKSRENCLALVNEHIRKERYGLHVLEIVPLPREDNLSILVCSIQVLHLEGTLHLVLVNEEDTEVDEVVPEDNLSILVCSIQVPVLHLEGALSWGDIHQNDHEEDAEVVGTCNFDLESAAWEDAVLGNNDDFGLLRIVAVSSSASADFYRIVVQQPSLAKLLDDFA